MTKYSKDFIKKVVALIEEDKYTITEICNILGISRKTLFQWKQAHPDLVLAMSEAVATREEKLKLKARHAMLKKLEGHKKVETKITYVLPKDGEDPNKLDIKEYIVKEKFCMPETSAIVHSLSEANTFQKSGKQSEVDPTFMINVDKEKTKMDMEMLRKKMEK